MVIFAIAFVYTFNYLDHLGLQKGSSDWIHRHNVNDFFFDWKRQYVPISYNGTLFSIGRDCYIKIP